MLWDVPPFRGKVSETLHTRPPPALGPEGVSRGRRVTWFLPGRTKHISGSPRHKGLKKTHFIKNMRQYDTRNSRYQVPGGKPVAAQRQGWASVLGPCLQPWSCPPHLASNLGGGRDLGDKPRRGRQLE